MQSGLGLPDESYYREEQYADVRAAYTAHVGRMLHLGGFGPWRPNWSMEHLANLDLPFLGVLSGVVDDPMGWKSRPGDIAPFLPPDGRVEFFDDIGHFLHIEQPRLIADMVLEFLEPLR